MGAERYWRVKRRRAARPAGSVRLDRAASRGTCASGLSGNPQRTGDTDKPFLVLVPGTAVMRSLPVTSTWQAFDALSHDFRRNQDHLRSAPHKAFELVGGPIQRLFGGFALLDV